MCACYNGSQQHLGLCTTQQDAALTACWQFDIVNRARTYLKLNNPTNIVHVLKEPPVRLPKGVCLDALPNKAVINVSQLFSYLVSIHMENPIGESDSII